jgi:hypothetical protein
LLLGIAKKNVIIMKSIFNRVTLKGFFSKGKVPTEVQFVNLIDSMVNKMDDGFDKTTEDGLRLSATGKDNNVLSIFSSAGEQNSGWQVAFNQEDNGTRGLSFDRVVTDNDGKRVKKKVLTLADNGNVGIGINTTPRTALEVGGVIGISTRVGTYKIGQVDGDGAWKDILTGLKSMHAFEIVARIDGPPKRGKYAITHAIAVSAFGGGRNRVKQVRAHYGWFWNRIEFRWHGSTTTDYSLQVRTNSNYGKKEDNTAFMIRYHITQLWDDALFQDINNPA